MFGHSARRRILATIGVIVLASLGIVGAATPRAVVASASASAFPGTSDLTSGWKIQSSAVATTRVP